MKTKFSNLSSEERVALDNLSKCRYTILPDTIAADKGGALVVWRTDLNQKKNFGQLSNTSFYAKVDKDLTSTKQQTVKSTINDLIVKQGFPAPATYLIITTPRAFTFYLKFINRSGLNLLYSLVQIHCDCCSLVWGNCNKTLSNWLQKLQNRAAQVVASSSYDHVDSLFH